MDNKIVKSNGAEGRDMAFGDIPASYDFFQQQAREQVQVEASQSARDRLSVDSFYLLAGDLTKRTGERMTTGISNLGAVDKMSLPAGWTPGEEKTGIAGQGSSRQFLAPGAKDVELTVFERGRRYSSNAAAFRDLLDKPAHVLSPKELESISTILGNYSDPRAFTMNACRTEDIGGKRVLVLEGSWNAVGHDSYSVLANPDGNGETVQEIYYKAPAADYKAHVNEAMQAIRSIRWK